MNNSETQTAGAGKDVAAKPEARWTYNPYRASLRLDNKAFAIVSPDGRNALSREHTRMLLDALNGPTLARREESSPAGRVLAEGLSAQIGIEHYFPKGYDPDAEPWKSIRTHYYAALRAQECESSKTEEEIAARATEEICKTSPEQLSKQDITEGILAALRAAQAQREPAGGEK